jgi:hypothetical protein
MRRIFHSSIVVLMMTAGLWMSPVHAGTEDDPEITSACGNAGLVPTHDSLDICSAWFGGIWRPGDSVSEDWVLDGLETTLRVERQMNDRPPYARYSLGWEIADCEMLWNLHHPAESAGWRVTFSHCLPDGTYRERVVSPDQISIEEDRIVVELRLGSDLSTVASLFSSGSRIEDLYATTLVGVETDSHPFETTYSIDHADGARAFVIGQDRPPDSQG